MRDTSQLTEKAFIVIITLIGLYYAPIDGKIFVAILFGALWLQHKDNPC